MNTKNRKLTLLALLSGLSGSAFCATGQVASVRPRAQPYLDWALAAGSDFVNLSAASDMPNIAPRSLATAFGANLAARTETATAPYRLTLGGISLQVIDSMGTVRLAQLLYVSPRQINYLVPMGTSKGMATVNIVSGTGAVPTSSTPVQTVAPALFTANGDGVGVVAATASRTVIPTNIAAPVSVYQCLDAPGSCVSVPIDVGVDAPVTVALYATGLQGRSSDSAVKLSIGGQEVPIQEINADDDSTPNAGVDVVVALLPLSLRGSGEVDVVLSVDGTSSNPARINIQ